MDNKQTQLAIALEQLRIADAKIDTILNRKDRLFASEQVEDQLASAIQDVSTGLLNLCGVVEMLINQQNIPEGGI